MILRTTIRIDKAIYYSWKVIVFSVLMSWMAHVVHVIFDVQDVIIPIAVVGVMGMALAIILSFRNASAYERWWEASKLWASIVSESLTLARQAMTVVNPDHVTDANLQIQTRGVINRHIGWLHALRLQLKGIDNPDTWETEVAVWLEGIEYTQIERTSNRATQILMLQGRAIKRINSNFELDDFSYVQMDDTLTRLAELQSSCERIKSTPLPRPFDYYTLAFLYIFVAFVPFGFVHELEIHDHLFLLFPLSLIISWIFYQIYILGWVLATPFENLETDVPLNAICRSTEIDLLQALGERCDAEKLKPVKGILM